MIKVAPSILAANFLHLEKELKKLEKAHADYIHFDVMDGHFVDNITFGPQILKQAKNCCNLLFDVHLMVENPAKFIPWYANAGADIITIHLEATNDPMHEINLIKSFGLKVGISIKPETPVKKLKPFLNDIDLVLIMAVTPGFGGQTFNENTSKKIKQLRELSSLVLIEVDGGINPKTAKISIDAGADILVAGTSIFKTRNYANNIKKIKGEI